MAAFDKSRLGHLLSAMGSAADWRRRGGELPGRLKLSAGLKQSFDG